MRSEHCNFQFSNFNLNFKAFKSNFIAIIFQASWLANRYSSKLPRFNVFNLHSFQATCFTKLIFSDALWESMGFGVPPSPLTWKKLQEAGKHNLFAKIGVVGGTDNFVVT